MISSKIRWFGHYRSRPLPHILKGHLHTCFNQIASPKSICSCRNISFWPKNHTEVWSETQTLRMHEHKKNKHMPKWFGSKTICQLSMHEVQHWYMDGKFLGIVKLPIFSASFWREQMMTRPKILTFQRFVLKLNSEELG